MSVKYRQERRNGKRKGREGNGGKGRGEEEKKRQIGTVEDVEH